MDKKRQKLQKNIAMDRYSFLNAANSQFFSDMYDKYLENPDSIEASWRAFFQGFDFALENYNLEQTTEQNYTKEPVVQRIVEQVTVGGIDPSIPEKIEKEFKVINLINGYRERGHLFTNTNPIGKRQEYSPDLSIENYGLSKDDLDKTFDAAKEIGLQPTTLRNIISQLNNIFCQSIGIEFAYIRVPEMTSWIKNKLRINQNQPSFSKEEKISILEKLSQAVDFENFLHTKYVGQKRFSLEGGEALVPALDILIEKGAEKGVKEFVIGMAHRGRLNVLANVMGKNPQDIFSEFDGKDYGEDLFDGDVKYHLGHTSKRQTKNSQTVTINLAPNPSHLETVGSVIQGLARAKQDRLYPDNNSNVLPISIHGDAAVAGQGIVYEVVQMSQLDGYKTGGTIHIVINNQVGFTTGYKEGRSSTYCTDIAKIIQSPILHVNSDDVEAVVHAMMFAFEFRMAFKRDVFIDLVGYRKYGHNEGDEPRFTQPVLYKIISEHPNPKEIYREKLKEQKIVEDAYLEEFEAKYMSVLDSDLQESRKKPLTVITPFMQKVWDGFKPASMEKMMESVDTTIDKKTLDKVAKTIVELPEKGFISKIKKVMSDRKTMYFDKEMVDWGMAENLAYGSLLAEGFDVRISGEDVERGTFSHRHAVVRVEDSEEKVTLLKNVQGGKFHIYNSLLSEYGVLGFEYGYALASPKTLTIWEAQFGDFSNGAQIMIDQYVCCGEDKWKTQNGLVMLLPHGYEGQGSEHSSARVERYLQLCANKNMFVANCTTPANMFHLLRKQMKTDYRKPLMIFTPKGLLRHPDVVSKVEQLCKGGFLPVIDDDSVDKKKVKTLVFVSGRFYYDLVAERKKLEREDVAFVRIEQLFPLPEAKIKEIIALYPKAKDYVWAQEEPKNMGAYGYMLMNFNMVPLRLASMGAFSAPASGSYTRDRKRHQEAIDKVFGK